MRDWRKNANLGQEEAPSPQPLGLGPQHVACSRRVECRLDWSLAPSASCRGGCNPPQSHPGKTREMPFNEPGMEPGMEHGGRGSQVADYIKEARTRPRRTIKPTGDRNAQEGKKPKAAESPRHAGIEGAR